ncbi:MAG TPA: ABC transporter permease [Gemmatimonadales bacterium]
MDTLINDIRYAVRALVKNPGFALVAIVTLALGIGANSAIFSVIDGVLLGALPYQDADHLYVLWETNPVGGVRLASYPSVQDWHAQSAFEVGYARGTGLLYRGADGPEHIVVAYVSPDFFGTLRPQMTLGRPLSATDDREGATIVISQQLWRSHFSSDPTILGRSITLGDNRFVVAGVVNAKAQYPEWADVWIPLGAIAGRDPALTARGLHVDSRTIARLKPGVPLARAQATMNAIAARIALAYPGENGGWTRIGMLPLRTWLLGYDNPIAARLTMLGAAVGLLLLIACANVTNLLLARSLARGREIAIRAALGAGRSRVVRQLLTEGAVVATLGAAGGVVLAAWLVRLARHLPIDSLPHRDDIVLDGRVLLFTAAVTLMAAVLVSLVPALRSSAPNLTDQLKAGAAAVMGRTQQRLRSVIVATEFALAVMLVSGAGLLVTSLKRLEAVDPGFNPSHLVTIGIAPHDRQPGAAVAYYRRMHDAVSSVPGVAAVALTNHMPLGGGAFPSHMIVPGAPAPGSDSSILFREVSPDYFATMQIPIRRGRSLAEGDLSGAPVALLNETAARRYFPGGTAVGHAVTLFKSAQGRPDFDEAFSATIIGVVGDVRHFGLSSGPPAEVYVPYTVNPWGFMRLVMRVGAKTSAVLPAIRHALLQADPDLPVASEREGLQTSDNWLADNVEPQRVDAGLLGSLASTALLLAAIGIYGLMTYAVTQRTHEIGIRMALGAARYDIVRLVFRHALVLVAAGLAAGLVGALASGRIIQSMLFATSPTDGWTLLTVTGLLGATALVATYIPARRATGIDPLTALRHD